MSNLELICDDQFNVFEIYNCKLSFMSDSLETEIAIDYGRNKDSKGKKKFNLNQKLKS